MLRKLCKECDTEITRTYTEDGVTYTCQACGETAYVNVDMNPFCPECDSMVELCVKCGTGFFCPTCKVLVSSKKIVWKQTE